MLRILGAGSVALLVAAAGTAYAQTSTSPSSPALKMTQAECQSLWNRLDSAKSGTVTESQAAQHVSDFKSADTNSDGKLSQAEFQSACDKGQVRGSATTGPGSGTDGSKK